MLFLGQLLVRASMSAAMLSKHSFEVHKSGSGAGNSFSTPKSYKRKLWGGDFLEDTDSLSVARPCYRYRNSTE